MPQVLKKRLKKLVLVLATSELVTIACKKALKIILDWLL